MAWQIQCKQHFLKQLYTLNNQLESEETLTWHEDEQMYCWDCMRVRGAVFCYWICTRVYESCMQKLLREVLWELLRFCDTSCWRCESCVMQSKYAVKPRLAPHSEPMLEVSPWLPSPTSPRQEPLSSLSNPLSRNLLEILLD